MHEHQGRDLSPLALLQLFGGLPVPEDLLEIDGVAPLVVAGQEGLVLPQTAARAELLDPVVGIQGVDVPEDPSRIGYQLSGNCDWEEEHGIEIVILDGKLIYLGEFSGVSPWSYPIEESWNSAAHIYE